MINDPHPFPDSTDPRLRIFDMLTATQESGGTSLSRDQHLALAHSVLESNRAKPDPAQNADTPSKTIDAIEKKIATTEMILEAEKEARKLENIGFGITGTIIGVSFLGGVMDIAAGGFITSLYAVAALGKTAMNKITTRSLEKQLARLEQEKETLLKISTPAPALPRPVPPLLKLAGPSQDFNKDTSVPAQEPKFNTTPDLKRQPS